MKQQMILLDLPKGMPLNHWCCAGTHPEYEFGTAGSIVLICPQCEAMVFRNPVAILHFEKKESCLKCNVELKLIKKES